MAECARCGQCCGLIGWNLEHGQRSWQEIETLALRGHPDAMFMVAHWHYCWGTGYYWCDSLDFDTHLCTVYEQRPKVCSGYPYYGSEVLPSKLHKGCAFGKGDGPLFALSPCGWFSLEEEASPF